MKVALDQISKNAHFDYCVIGTGPAGITVARKLARSGKKIALLEGGTETYTLESQDLYRGKVIGDKYFTLESARLRYFGGTSNHWGGMCRPLDAHDFEAKGLFSKTAWPINKTDLDKYLTEASHILGLNERMDDEVFEESGLIRQYFSFSEGPVRFAQKYTDELFSSNNISVFFDANVTSFITNGDSVSSVEIYNKTGEAINLKANTFVLATGGIENSRVLLWANKKTNGLLIKNPESLGKYWMEHPTFTVGQAILSGELATNSGVKDVFFSPTKRTIKEQKILNCSLRFEPVNYSGAKKIISNLACVAPELGIEIMSLLDKHLICGALLRASWEQEPVPENRIELSDDLDSVGMPRVNLYWKKNETDLRTVQKTVEVFGKYLAKKNLGRIRFDDWVLGKSDYPDDDELAGYHHMGGTRMASNPKEGIVDSNCKVHGQKNLYIAGSSIFPSGGCANSTLTIVQLAIRLGEHLATTRN